MNNSIPALEGPSEVNLERALFAFEQGDYVTAKTRARALLRDPNREIAAEAARIIDRLEPPPLSKYILALTAALLLGVSIFAYFS